VNNTGNEIIGDFQHMDILVYDKTTKDYSLCTYDKSGSGLSGTWSIISRGTDDIHPWLLDPGESYEIIIITTPTTTPDWFQITTSNGVYASTYV
jgi:hypothetical protein